MAEPIWWAVARSEEITGTTPLNADIGDQPLVLWRDRDGIARALEDRCPHRRAPLSLGCILGNGAIQCGYHGWTFAGDTGRLVDIPNLKGQRRYPPVYRARAFGVAESGGWVRVCLEAGAAPPPPATGAVLPLGGTTNVALDHAHYLDALFDDPGLLLTIRGVRFTPYLMSELAAHEGRLVLERSCQWATPHWPAPFAPEFPITLRIATDPASGESELLLRDEQYRPLLRALLAPVPAARGVTQVRWRARREQAGAGLAARALRVGPPLRIHPHVDGAALRVLKPSASLHAVDLRRQLAPAMAGEEAAA